MVIYELQILHILCLHTAYLMPYTIQWPVTKRTTARSANLRVLVYTERHRTKLHIHGSPSKTHSLVVGGGETQ